MKIHHLALCLSLAACGGNWSNEDLEFLNAMPSKESLQSKLPSAASGGLSGEGTRSDGLLGEVSQLYTGTKKASTDFNGILEFVIGVLETVRAVPPTTRSLDLRIWGPLPDKDNPGFEARVVIQRVSEAQYNYAIQHRNTQGGEFFNSVVGTFKPTATLRRGTGLLIVDTKTISANLPSAAGFAPLEKIEIGYVTDTFPTTVAMKFTVKPAAQLGGLSGIGYTYRELADKSGQIHFAYRTTSAEVSELNTLTRWLPTGAGGAVAVVTEGTFKGAVHFECWDTQFKITFEKQNWDGGVEAGDAGSCVQVPGFDPAADGGTP